MSDSASFRYGGPNLRSASLISPTLAHAAERRFTRAVEVSLEEDLSLAAALQHKGLLAAPLLSAEDGDLAMCLSLLIVVVTLRPRMAGRRTLLGSGINPPSTALQCPSGPEGSSDSCVAAPARWRSERREPLAPDHCPARSVGCAVVGGARGSASPTACAGGYSRPYATRRADRA